MKPRARARVRQADITRAIKAYEAAGYARGSFRVTVEPSGAIVLTPIDADQDEAADLERRMREAFN